VGSTAGYGRVGYQGKSYDAHRLVYILSEGPVAEGKELDHLCRVRHCVNPDHLREVTRRENLLADGSLSIAKIHAEKTHCKHGHEFTSENTYQWRNQRHCLACRRVTDKERWPKRKEQRKQSCD
jgi:hypothetical protein